MQKKMCIITSVICFGLLLALFYYETRYPEAGSEFIRSLITSGQQA